MAVIVKFANTDKKRNSTKIITAFPLSLQATIKEPTSITNPVLIVEDTDDILKYNYLMIDAFKRYYYIDDIVSINHNLWEISASVDTLASFRSEILNNEVYVLRSASERNGYIFDSMYPVTANHASREDIIAQPLLQNVAWSEGYYVVSTISDNATTGLEGIALYVMQAPQFKTQFNRLFASYSSGDWGGLADNIKRALFDPASYIASAYWFPCPFYAPFTGHFKAGNWDSGSDCPQSDGTLTALGAYVIDIPKHPLAATHGDYLNGNGFTEYTLDLGICPPVKLDSSLLVRASKLSLTIYVDPMTGLGDVRIMTNLSFTPIARFTVPFGVPVNIAVSKNNQLNAFANIASAGVSLAAGDPFGAIGGLVSGSIESVKQGVGIVGGGSGSASLAGHSRGYRLYTTFFYPTERDNADKGSPLAARRVLGNLSGYTQTQADALQISGALDPEYQQILSALNSGVFIE